MALLLIGFGSPESHAEAVARFTEGAAPMVQFASPIPYTALQQLVDEPNQWGQCNYEKGTQLAELTDEVIDILVERLPSRISPTTQVMFYRLDGAYSEVAEDATAYGGGRSARYAAMLVAVTPDIDTWTADREWVRGLWDALQPHSLGIGDYVNNMVEFDTDRIIASYGADKYRRLCRIKALYDPANVFRAGVNIPPASD